MGAGCERWDLNRLKAPLCCSTHADDRSPLLVDSGSLARVWLSIMHIHQFGANQLSAFTSMLLIIHLKVNAKIFDFSAVDAFFTIISSPFYKKFENFLNKFQIANPGGVLSFLLI